MNSLDDQQLAAAIDPAPFKVVSAGPGSGKTRCLVAAVLELWSSRFKPSEVAVVTFTTAAATELEQRLEPSLRPRNSSQALPLGFCGTIHALLLSLLRSHGSLVGVWPSCSICDDHQAEEMMRECAEKAGSKTSLFSLLECARDILGFKNDASLQNWMTERDRLVVKQFADELRASCLLTFEMVLSRGVELVRYFRKHPAVWPYRALFLDEAQDCSPAEFDLLEAAPCVRKFAVGDIDQSIFRFRGAAPERFRALFDDPQWKAFSLERNYRSAANICAAAARVITADPQRLPRRLLPTREGGTVEVQSYPDCPHELAGLTERVAKLAEQGVRPEEMAVLARTNKEAQAAGSWLLSVGVPIRMAAEKKPELTSDWTKAKLLLQVAANPYSDAATYRYLCAVLGKERADAARRDATKAMLPLAQNCFGVSATWGDPSEVLKREGFRAGTIELVAEAWRGCRGGYAELSVRLAELEKQQREQGQGVACLTMHAAKGREWRAVFVIGCEQSNRPQDAEELADERRLFFVACTRAIDWLFLSWSESRFGYGPAARKRSPFLDDLEKGAAL